jgi:hypothetical protein
MGDENKLMGIPFGKMRADDPRTGLTPADIAYLKFVSHPKHVSEIPTSQEVVDRTVHLDDEFDHSEESDPNEAEPDADEDDSEETDEEETEETEEQKLRTLLSSLLKSIREYFCQGSHA